MVAAAMEAPFSVVSSYPKFHSLSKSVTSVRFHIVPFARSVSLRSHLLYPSHTAKRTGFQLRSVVETATVEEEVAKPQNSDNRRKLYVLNLPWSLTVVQIKDLFGQCGAVADVEIIKQKNGKSRGFAFVTMSSAEEAQAVIEKFDSYEVSDRIIRVQFAKRFKRPPHTPPPSPPGETFNKLYVSNLAWKVRSNSLREFLSTSCNPLSVRVVFDGPSGRSAGYGFVSFATKEEAESAISLFDNKELLGRPIRLKFSEKNADASESKEESVEEQPESL